jgi:hypothetical protein
MDFVEERFGCIGLASVRKDVIAERCSGGGSTSDELGRLTSELTAEWVDELSDALLACGGSASTHAVNAACGVGEREMLALVLALQQRSSALSLAAFRLHVVTSPRARLHDLVLVGFVRAMRALNAPPQGADADGGMPTAAALECALRELRDALAAGASLPADPAQTLIEAACEILRSGLLGAERGRQHVFDTLGCLLPEHATMVFRALVPMVALTFDGASATAVAREATNLQRQAAEFVTHTLASCGAGDEPVLDAAHALVQHAMTAVPDKAEYRAGVSRAATAIVSCMTDDHVGRYFAFVGRLARNGKPQLRTVACDGALDALCADSLVHAPRERLYGVLLCSTRDKSTTVRARAVGALAALLERCPPGERVLLVRALETAAAPPRQQPPHVDSEEVDAGTDAGSTALVCAPSPAHDAPAPAVALRALLVTRCRDTKPIVRKLAVSALCALATAEGGADGATLEVLGVRCRDTSLAVRKAAALALGALFDAAAAGDAAAVGGAWLSSLAALSADVEASVRELAAGALCGGLFEPLALGAKSPRAAVAWAVLDASEREGALQLRRVCAQLAKGGGLPKGLGKALQRSVGEGASSDGEPLGVRARAAAWGLLEELAASRAHCKEIQVDAIASQWAQLRAGAAAAHSAAEVDALGALNTLVQLARHGLLPASASEALVPGLHDELLACRASPALCRSIAHAYAAACAAVGKSPKQAWARVLAACETALGAHASARGRAEALDGVLGGETPAGALAVGGVLTQVFLVGEIALLCDAAAAAGSSAADVVGESLVRALEAEAVPRGSERVTCAERIALQAQAIVSLGKLCGARAALAKRLVPMLVLELHESASPAVRNNCLFVLADLIKQYTVRREPAHARTRARTRGVGRTRSLTRCLTRPTDSHARSWTHPLADSLPDPTDSRAVPALRPPQALVDRHVPALALSMADSQPLVRYHGVVLVTRLLLTDFVRWKPLVLRAFALALADDEPRVRDIAVHCLVEQLLPRQPQLLGAHLVELIAHLNGCAAHAAHVTAAALSGAQEARLQLAGAHNRARRAQIYSTLAGAMPDEVKLVAMQKLLAEVLTAAADGSLPLHAHGAAEMVADALGLASSGALKLATARAAALAVDGDEPAADEPALTGAAKASSARAKVMAAASTKLFAESALPVAIELRRALEAARSPLLGMVMAFVRELVRESKELLAELGRRDKEFAVEIEFDLSRAGSQQQPHAGALVVLAPAAERAAPHREALRVSAPRASARRDRSARAHPRPVRSPSAQPVLFNLAPSCLPVRCPRRAGPQRALGRSQSDRAGRSWRLLHRCQAAASRGAGLAHGDAYSLSECKAMEGGVLSSPRLLTQRARERSGVGRRWTRWLPPACARRCPVPRPRRRHSYDDDAMKCYYA